jgi:hypothetical protein
MTIAVDEARPARILPRATTPPGSHLADLGKIKGVAFGEFIGWYELRYGHEPVRRAVLEVDAVHPGQLDAARIGFGVLASHWYPAPVVHTLLDCLTRNRTESELQSMAVDAADHIMKRTLRGVYRAIFTMIATPDRYVRHIDRLWSMHYDTGSLVAQRVDETTHRVTYVGWTSHHPFICRLNMAASLPLYGAMGCRDVTYERVRCVSQGGANCENLVRWKK